MTTTKKIGGNKNRLKGKMKKATMPLSKTISFPMDKTKRIETLSKPKNSKGGNSMRIKKRQQLKTILKEGRTLGNIERKNPKNIFDRLKQFAYAYMSEGEVRRKINLIDKSEIFTKFRISEYLKWADFQYWEQGGFIYYSNKSPLNINGLTYRIPLKISNELVGKLKAKKYLNILDMEKIVKTLDADRYNGYITDEFMACLGFSEDSIRKALKRNLVFRTIEQRNSPQHKHSGLKEILGLNSTSPKIMDCRLGNVTQSFKHSIVKRIMQGGGFRHKIDENGLDDMDIIR